jgi:broad specificity phosphatase PhoE
MALLYLIRHGEPDYSFCDERGYIGHGRDLAPLSEEGERQALKAASDPRLIDADIILSSPYTRALQTAAIISRIINKPIKVEIDLHEWMPDLTFQYKSFEECLELNNDFNKHKGIYPKDQKKRWESLDSLKTRVNKVIEKYVQYDKVIVVCHGMAIRTIKYVEKIELGEIIECNYHMGKEDCTFPFL